MLTTATQITTPYNYSKLIDTGVMTTFFILVFLIWLYAVGTSHRINIQRDTIKYAQKLVSVSLGLFEDVLVCALHQKELFHPSVKAPSLSIVIFSSVIWFEFLQKLQNLPVRVIVWSAQETNVSLFITVNQLDDFVQMCNSCTCISIWINYL